MTNRHTRAVLGILGLLAGPAITSATGCGKAVQSMDLPPAQLRTEFSQDSEQQTLYNCPLNTMGCAPPANTAEVGFYNRYQPGTPPFACWQWVGCFYRGFVAFDLSPLSGKSVVGASLRWVNKTERATGTVASNEGHCLQSLRVATGSWSGLNTPGDPLFGDLQSNQAAEISLEVGPTVRNWVLGTTSNHGLFFVGLKEGFSPESSDVCTTTLQNLRLHVLYTD